MVDQNPEPVVLGLDIGTLQCAAATLEHGKVRAISDALDRKTAPSNFMIHADGCFQISQDHTTAPPSDGLFVTSVKRVLGRSDGYLENDIALLDLPFAVSDEGTAVCNKGDEQILPEELYALSVMYMVRKAEQDIGKKATHYGLAIPANFGDGQRRAVLSAADIAGIRNPILINEPSAAAVAYQCSLPDTTGKNLLVVDVGGGTTDCALVSVYEKTTFVTKATSGHNLLGGEDFTKTLVDMVNDRKKDHGLSQHDLRLACENAKVNWGSSQRANTDVRINLHKSTYVIKHKDHLTAVQDLLDQLKEVINEIQEICDDVDNVILVGGGCSHPLVLDLCTERFGREKVIRPRNSATIVAEGAALAANPSKNITITEVLSQPIGVDTQIPSKGEVDVMETILQQNRPLPCSGNIDFTAVHDKETSINIFSGDKQRSSHNTNLQEFLIPVEKGQIFRLKIKAELDGTYKVLYTMNGVEKEIGKMEGKAGMSEDKIKALREKAQIRFRSDAASDPDAASEPDAASKSHVSTHNGVSSKRKINEKQQKEEGQRHGAQTKRKKTKMKKKKRAESATD